MCTHLWNDHPLIAGNSSGWPGPAGSATELLLHTVILTQIMKICFPPLLPPFSVHLSFYYVTVLWTRGKLLINKKYLSCTSSPLRWPCPLKGTLAWDLTIQTNWAWFLVWGGIIWTKAVRIWRENAMNYMFNIYGTSANSDWYFYLGLRIKE